MAKNIELNKKKTVLIVEDEKNIARAEGIILSKNFNVHYAEDGEEALAMAKKVSPDLIILDLMLPKRGGYDVCFQLRQHPILSSAKIIMVTAKNLPIDKDKGKFIGADFYITKPFEPDDLRNAVNQVLSE